MMTPKNTILSENYPIRPRSLVGLSRLRVLVLGLVMVLLPSVVQAAPSWFVVSTDTQSVRCGDQEIYYTIEEYPQGTMLMIDGTSGDYSKVRYPAQLGAFVPAREVQEMESGTHVRLVVGSQLRAASMLRGLEGSWCPVFEKPLAAGTEMKILEIVEDKKKEVLGYRVIPPRPPVGDVYPMAYILTDSIRAATDAEIARHLAGDLDGGLSPKEGKPQRVIENPKARPQLLQAPPMVNHNTDHATGHATDDSTTVGGSGGTDDGQSAPMTMPDAAHSDAGMPDESPVSEPVSEPVSDFVSDEPVVIENTIPQTIPQATPQAAAPRLVNPGQAMTPAALEALEASFTKARSMPREQLDLALPELLAEFTRTRQAAGDDEDLARPLDQRIEWLKIRIQTRDQRQAIARVLAQNDQQSKALRDKIEQWNSSRVYSLVGRLMLSGVYTGEHLPLLYRLRSPDPVTGIERTIGYIAPKPDQDLRRYLGSLVGVVGTPVHDDALSLVVLSPSRVDVMPGQ